MQDKTDYKTLENKYGNFAVPSYKIKIDGMDTVSKLDITVSELDITLSLDSASMAVLKIIDIYDIKKHTFDANVKSKFKLGAKAEIEIGYLSSTTAVFKGFIAGVGAEFGDVPALVVKLMDVRYLMISSGVKRVLHESKNYSDVFQSIMKNYSSLCSVKCEATSDTLEKPISQNTDDFSFITRELLGKGKAEREFFVFLDKAYFRKIKENTTPIMKVMLGRELFKFEMMADYIDMFVQVVGYDPVNQKEIVSKVKAKSPESMTSLLNPAPIMLYIDPDVDSEKKAKTRADTIAKSEVDRTCYAVGELVGLPEIVPGRYIEIEALEKMADKKYYITEVVHKLTSSDFITRFEAKGWS